MTTNFESREQTVEYKTHLLSKDEWPNIKQQFINIFQACFAEYKMPPTTIESIFTKTYGGSNDVVVLLNDEISKELVGFTAAHIYTDSPELANIGFSAIRPDKQGQGLIGELMDRLEGELKQRGVEYITRESRIQDGYADSVERHYKDQIVETKDFDGKDPKRYFKIKLK